jgi:tetratricopeptide (TPR) repeat protein
MPTLEKALAEGRQLNTVEAYLIVAETYERMAFVQTQYDPDAALAASQHQTEAYLKAAQLEPDNVQVLDGLATSYNSAGAALNRRLRYEEALALYRKGLAIREKLAAQHPNDVALRRDLMISYGRIGDQLGNPSRGNLHDRAGALENFGKARAIAESLAAADPDNRLAKMDLAQIWARLGMAMDQPAEEREAVALLDAAREEIIGLVVKEPTSEQERLISWIDESRGAHFASKGDTDAAVGAYRLALEEGRSAARKHPKDYSAHLQIFMASKGLGPQLALRGQREEALRVMRECANAVEVAMKGAPDPTMYLTFVPRSFEYTAATYEALASRGKSAAQRRADWAAAAEAYRRGYEEWQKFSTRKDFFRYQSDVNEAARKAAECARKSRQG